MPPKDESDNIKGYLCGKDKDDVDRYVREIVQQYLDTRPFTQKDELAIREAVKEMFELRLAHHESQCAKQRSKSGHSTLTVIISTISILISLGMGALVLWKILNSIPTP